MRSALYYRMMRSCKAIFAALLVAVAARAAPAEGVSAEELELFAKSLRPQGRAELEGNAAPLAQLPVVEVQAELDPAAARVEGQLRLVVRNREAAPWHGSRRVRTAFGIAPSPRRSGIGAMPIPAMRWLR